MPDRQGDRLPVRGGCFQLDLQRKGPQSPHMSHAAERLAWSRQRIAAQEDVRRYDNE